MSNKSILIAGLITADHIMINNGEDWKYLGSIGGGSAANVYFALKTFNLPVKLIGAVGNKKPWLSKIALRDLSTDNDNDIIHYSENSETREYFHIIKHVNNNWSHKFSSSLPFSNIKQTSSVQFRKSYFFKDFKKSIDKCEIFFMDRLSKGLLEFAEIAKKNKTVIVIDFGTISTRYLKTDLVLKAIELADIIQVPKKIHNFLIKNLDFKNFQEINPKIKIWIITDGSNPLTVYHSKIGEVLISVPQLDEVIDSGGAGDAFMTMLIIQIFNFKFRNITINELDRKQFKNLIYKCVENAKKACLFMGSRTYLYEYLENRSKFRSLNDYFDNYKYEGDYYEKSIILLENYGKRIQEINDQLNNLKENNNIILKTGIGQFESNLLNIPLIIPNALKNNLEIQHGKDLGANLIVIGSGASFSAAKAIQQIFQPPNNNLSVHAFTPYQYILKVNEAYPICIISSSGTNPDVKSCFKKAVNNKCRKILLLTTNENSYLAEQVNNYKNGCLIPIKTLKDEKGFVGVYSMMASICVLAKFLFHTNWKDDYNQFLTKENLEDLIIANIKKIHKNIKEKLKKHKHNEPKYHVIALGTNWSEPALCDFESKIVECNLGTIEISELKNFTHGRYINLYKNLENKFVVIFKTPETKKLSNFLEVRLSEITPTFVLETNHDKFIGMIDLFIQMLIFVNELGKYYNQDPSKPGFPKMAKGLYNWNGLY